MPKKLPTKRKIRKAISVNKPQSFLALPDSVRYQIYLFKNAILKYKKDVIRDLQKKLAKLQNTYNKDYIYFQTFNVKEYLIDVKSDLSEKLTLALKIFKAKLKEWSTQFKNFILAENQKETTIFKNTKIPLTFKPFYLTQGALVFAALLVIAITATTIIFPRPKPTLANIINQKSITIKQTSAAVAGSSDNIKWTAIIKKSDITNNKYLLKLPKTATNIKVKTISKQEAIALSNDRVPTAILAMSDRKVLAYQTVPATIFSKISKLMNYILADLEQAVTDAVQTITEQPLPELTPEATLVDLSAEIPVVVDTIALTTADEKKADAESQKQENKELKETEKEPASVENFGEAKEKQDEKQETKQENQEKQEEVSVSSEVALTSDVIPATSLAESRREAGIQSGSSDINTNLDSPLQGNDNEIQGNDNEIQGNDNEIQGNDNEIQGNDNEDDYIAVEYETSSPIITEQDTATGKIVTVSDPNETTTQSDLGSNDMFQDSNDVIPADAGIQSEGLDSLLQGNDNTTSLTNILAFTTIPEIYKVGQEKAIRIKWKNNNDQPMEFHAFDLNNNGKLDYIEWIVPHLSDQIFEIILISRAYHLDSNQEILEDVYDQVKTKDNNFATIPADNYIRVTFEKVLDSSRDITVYAKPTVIPAQAGIQIEVYPVYTDENGIQTQGPKLDLVNDGANPDFSSIDAYAKYRILLTNLSQPTDMFDLKVINASIDFDNIFDPVTDRYWVGGTGSWSDDDNHWALTSGGAAGNGNIPVNGDNVIFDASSGTGTVTIDTASVSMLNVTESSANIIVATSTNGITVTGDLYVAGTISGATAVTVSGAGKTITMGASSTISAPLTLGADATVSVGTGNTGTISGIISGAYNLAKTGAGQLTLTGANTYTGATTISQGTLSANKIVVSSSNSSLGNATSAVVLGGAATSGTLYSTQGTISYTRGFTVNAGGGEVDTSTGTLTVATGGITANGPLTVGRTGTMTISAIIADGGTAGSLVKVGTTTLTLSGANTFTGILTVKAGTLTGATSLNCFGLSTAADAITLGETGGTADAYLGDHPGTYAAPLTQKITVAAQASGTIGFTFSGDTIASDIVLNYPLTIMNSSGTSNLKPSTISGTGNIIFAVGGTGFFNIYSDISTTGTITNQSTTGNGIAISGVIGSNVTGVIQNSATSQLTLSGANTFTSGLTIKAGTLQLSTNAAAAGTGTITIGDSSGSADAGLQVGGGYQTYANPITVASGNSGTLRISCNSTSSLSGAITINKDLTVMTAGGNITLSGGITGTGNLTLFSTTSTVTLSATSVNNTGTITNSGTGIGIGIISAVIGTNVTGVIQNSSTSQLTLSGNNSTVGDIDIQAGTLTLAADKNLNVSDDWSNAGTFTASSGSTVTFTAGNHTVTGANTFVNWTWSANNTVTLPASTTQTISGAMTCTGTAGNLITLNSATSGTKATISDASGTNNCDYMSITDSSATGGATFNAANSTGSNYDGWLGLNVAPNAPTLVSPANASYTTDTTPTLSANYSDNDAGDTGTTNYRISSSSLADCANNTNVVASGTSSATTTNNEDTTWTNGSSIGSDATYYWCAQNNDGTDTSSWTQMGSFTLDIASPTTVIAAGRNGNNINTTLTCSDTSGSGCTYTYYCYDTTNTCAPTTVYTTIDTHPITQTTYIRYYSVDAMSNANSVASEQFDLVGGSASAIPATPAEQPPLPNIIEQIAQQIQNIANTLDSRLRGNDNETAIIYPPIEESVPVKPQKVFQGSNIISQAQLEKINILPLPESVKELAIKFPKFAETLEKVGIQKPEDIKKLQATKLSFPGLAEASGVKSDGALISTFTRQEKQNMPANVTFARLGNKNIDLNINVTISSSGVPTQSIRTIENKPVYLVVKPDNPVTSINGYIVFKSANSESAFLNFIKQLPAVFTASLMEATNLQKNTGQTVDQVTAKKDVVLSKFDYDDQDNDGIWTATINAPISGKYEIRTVLNYEKPKANQNEKELSMVMVVDPEGYIYEKIIDNKEIRVSGAVVSIYWLNPNTKKYELWPAKEFQQQNPQTTDNTGRYSFLVPTGNYYLEIASKDYFAYKSEPFQVTEGSGIHQNIQLQVKNIWLRIFSIERIMLGIVIILLLTISFALLYLIFRKKQ